MNTEHLIDTIHEANTLHREAERRAEPHRRLPLWLTSAAAVAALLAAVLLPNHHKSLPTQPPVGIYCNNQCSAAEVRILIDENINHIKTIQMP